MASLEVVEILPSPEVPWAASDLAELLDSQDPRSLPNAKRLSHPAAPATPAEYNYHPRDFIVLLPNIGAAKDFVLRATTLPRASLIRNLADSQRELRRLSRIGAAEGIGQLLIPHAVFTAENDPYTWKHAPHPQTSMAEYSTVYTIIEKVEDGQNLRGELKDPASQGILLAIAKTQVAYFQGVTTPPGYTLYDTSAHYQYSLQGRLYDIAHAGGNHSSEIAEDIDELYKWARQLLPSPEKRAVLKDIRALRSAYPKSTE